jgi:alpha-L-arabinofuranosidase
MLDALKPSFVRFPGGCWVEGDDLAHMYHWKNTVGDIAHRQPLWNIWQYWATHGLGYHEYLQLSEDLGAEPLFCINVGMSHRENVPLDQMGPWVQDALDALEYANGPTNTVWGSLRAKNGHPAPFNLKYLEIGNENGGPAYHERWELFHQAVKARCPDIQLIANVWGGYPTNRMPDIIDEHYYNNPEFFMQQADRYDRYDRKGPKIFVGEYAVTSGAGLGNLRGAIGEAAFMTGLERNSDIVLMASYAPMFCNANHKRWPINLINFDSSRAYGLPSYYVQKLFSEHRGDVVLPIAVEAPLATSSPKGGAVGVGTWATQAEFKDLRVTRGSETLFSADFAEGTKGWKLLGNGEWQAKDGVLRQNKLDDNLRAVAGDRSWTDYTYSLKARKLGGAEGFLILFALQDDNAKSWWNLGGWGNTRHALELGGIIGNEVNGRIETGRWYDIRIELKDRSVKCYLDGQLLHDATVPTMKSLYASASRDRESGEVIVKVVNVSNDEVPASLRLTGGAQVAGPVTAIVLTSEKPTDENTLEQPTKVSPETRTFTRNGPTFDHRFPGDSLTVFRLKVQP